MTSKIYTIANHKGGCSKTTTVKAMAETLSRVYNKKVLCIDTDPQGNLTSWSGINTEDEFTLYELLSLSYSDCTSINQIIYSNTDYDIIPADMSLAGIVNELTSTIGNERQLKNYLESVMDNYDYILIDTPPALNILSINAFVASDGIVIATDSNMFATKGIYKFFETITSTKKYYNNKLEIVGVLLTKFDKRFVSNKVIEEVTQKLTDELDIPMFQTRVRTSVGVTNATTYSVPLLDVHPEPKPVTDYKNFVAEFLEKEQN